MSKKISKQFMFFTLLFVFITILVSFNFPYTSADTIVTTWTTLNSTNVQINATYNESVDCLPGYPKLFGADNHSYSMDTTHLNDGKTFLSIPKWTSALPVGTYTYIIAVADFAGNQRNDSKIFEILQNYPPGCGNGMKEGTEECDDGNQVAGDGCSAFCRIERCGNNKVDPGEECDGTDLNGMTCTFIGKFSSGALACNANCTFNFQNCVPEYPNGTCGDQILNDKEACDNSDWGSITKCSDFSGFVSGTLKCRSNCHFNTDNCNPSSPGNNASCSDSKKDGDESDVDCGGSCTPCDNGKKCITYSDCNALYCKNNICTQPSCTDQVKNGLESDVDCGGSCPGCEINKSCRVNNDCASNFCNPNIKKCATPSCSDRIQNGDESDVDCGGGCLTKCALGKNCVSSNDCESGYCEAGICSNPNNNNPNNEETTPEKSHTLQILLLIFGLLLMIGSIGFLVYSRKVLIPKQKAAQAAAARTSMQQSKPGQQMPGARSAITGKPGMTSPRQDLKARIAERIAQRKNARQSLLEGFGKGKTETGEAGTAKSGKPESESEEKKSSQEFVSLSDLGKKQAKPTAKEDAGEKTAKESPKPSATFEKLKELSDSYKKKQVKK